jgi:hypothetical protein
LAGIFNQLSSQGIRLSTSVENISISEHYQEYLTNFNKETEEEVAATLATYKTRLKMAGITVCESYPKNCNYTKSKLK